MKFLFTVLAICVTFTAHAQTKPHYANPEPIFSIQLDKLVEIQCSDYLTHITKETCIAQITSCIFNRLAIRQPVLATQEEMIIHSYLYCTEDI